MWTKWNILYLRMLCTKFGWNKPSGSWRVVKVFRNSGAHIKSTIKQRTKCFSHLRVVFELLGFKLEHFKTFLTHEAQYIEKLF